MKPTWLVTGGAGFIGSNFVLEVCQEQRANVINLDKLTYAGNVSNLSSLQGRPDHKLVVGDIGDRDLLARLLEDFKPMAIIHFAAESHVDRSITDPEAFVRTNVLGTFNLLEIARHYWSRLTEETRRSFRFVHISTDEVYGSLEPHDPPFHETKAYEPNSPYSASKAGSDHLVRSYFHTYGLPTITTNCSNNYGPYQFPEKLIPLMMIKALANEPLPIYGDGQNIRDWLYVEDHVRGIITALEKGRCGQTYNVGGQSEKTNLEVVQTLCDILDRQLPRQDSQSYQELISFVADRPGHDRRYAIDSRKINQELGWYPTETFESGLEKTVTWYLNHQSWWRTILDKKYQGERLGLNQEQNSMEKGASVL